jgi:hypothetical protein
MTPFGAHAPLAADDSSAVAAVLRSLLAGWQRLRTSVSDPYRPERHYMRGRGPKWHAKHRGQVGVAAFGER